jgi:Reverse transcriptase (RNA-dependent DNA polymerase)
MGSELKSSAKPFAISKREVWEAYEQVKANNGAPGADGVTLEAFEKDLKRNLYKIWNRMSSGSYFPPPVAAVEIPKPHGDGVRVLGVPTVADRVAQTVVARRLEGKVEPIFHPDSYGYRPGRSALDAIAVCRQRCWRYDWVIDLDVQKFFDSVPWDLVIKAVTAHSNTEERWVVLYGKRWLAAPIQQPDGTLQQRDRGTHRGRRSRPCWRTCFCMTPSMRGWPASSRPSRSNGRQTTPSCTASANGKQPMCGGRSPAGWSRSGYDCIPTRPRSWTARTTTDLTHLRRRARPSRSWAPRSAPAQPAIATAGGSLRSCPRSAPTP